VRLYMTVADGVSETQARVIWHVVAEARAGRFAALAVHAELVTAGYTALVQEVVERMAKT
jgi:hypothetical protein